MNVKPTVTYIIPCFNQSEFLFETVRSAISSYSGPKEIIIIDDYSTASSTKKFINEIKRNFPYVILVNNPVNKGLSATRNIGISLSTGDYIQFLDADDLLIPGKVDFQIEHFRLANNLDISITDFYLSDEELVEFSQMEPSVGTFELSLDDFLYKWERGLTIPIHCALFRRHVFENMGFEESLYAKEDWVFWCKQAHLKRNISFLNINGALYRQHSAAMTKSNHMKMGEMWLKATLIINEFIENYEFLNHSLDWYQTHYKILNDSNSNKISQTKKLSEKISLQISNLIISPVITLPHKINEEEIIFSILVPVYNHAEYISMCFESILKQTFSNYEIICIDDNSTDPQIKVFLNKLQMNIPNITVQYNKENEGISSSLNKGVELAKGRYIVFLDCDDYLPQNALEEVYKQIVTHPEVDYFFTDKIDVNENGQFIREAFYGGYKDLHPSGCIEDDLLDGMVASHLKVIKRSLINKLGGFNNELDGVQDYDLALRAIGNANFFYINKSLYFHRQHLESITKSQSLRQFRNMNIARRNYLEKDYPKEWSVKTGILYYKNLINSIDKCSPNELVKKGIAQFYLENLSTTELKKAIKQRKLIFLDARIEYKPEYKFFIREYNSYFDLIHTDNALLAISILGTLWDDKILWKPSFIDFNKKFY